MSIKSFCIINKNKILTIFVYLLCFLIAVWAVETKDYYDVDEVFTYGLSNHQYVDTTEMRPVEGQMYEPAGNAWYDYMVVHPDGRFDYANVWKNQREDVHPIFYYVLVHTISSFFPNQFSRWFAGIVNVVFLILTLYIVRKIVDSLTHDKRTIFFASVFFSLCGGIAAAIRTFRMYTMAMFFVTLLTWMFIRLYREEADRRLYIKLALASVLGALTHYYVIVYLVLVCVVYGLLILTEKKFGEFARLAGCMAVSAAGSVLIFPAMLRHFFVSDRGKQSVEGFVEDSMPEYVDALRNYAGCINRDVFGGIILPILTVLLILFIIKKLKCRVQKRAAGEMLILAVPAVLYFLIISRIAVYNNAPRYIQPIYGVVVTAGICAIYFGAHTVMRRRKADFFVALSVAGMIIGSCFYAELISFNAQEDEEGIKYSDYDALYIYKEEERWKIQAGFGNFKDCKSITFISENGFDYIYESSIFDADELLVIIQDEIREADFYLVSIAGVCPNLKSYEEADYGGRATIYYLE